MKYTLITGSHGFLGKAVLDEYKKYNDYILIPTSKELDLTNESSTMNYFDIFRPNKILHMAAYVGGIGRNLDNPFNMIYLNSKMATNIFTAIDKYGCDYLCALGSVCMYGSNCPTPFKEDDMLNESSHFSNRPYGDSKRFLLSLLQAFKRQHPNFKSSFLVPVNLTGPNDSFDLHNSHVVPGLIRKFSEAKINNSPEVKCFGTGKASRELLFVNDCAKAVVNAVVNEIDYPDPINLGTGKSILIKDLAYLISELVEYKGNIVFTGEIGDGQAKRQLDVSRAKQVLGFEAKTDLRTALKNTINWYADNKDKT